MGVLGIAETLVMMPAHRRDAQYPLALQNLFKHALEMRQLFRVVLEVTKAEQTNIKQTGA